MKLRIVLPRLVLGLALAAAAGWVLLNRNRIDTALIENLTRDLGAWAPLVHVMLFAIGTVAFVPGAIFGLAGGALFGPLWGTMLNLVGATLGATAAFLVARYVAQDWVRRKAAGRLDRLLAGVEAEGWRFVALVRLVPLVPFNLSNYALGLTRIQLVAFVAATFVCMAPGTLAYTWLGYAGREAIEGSESAVRAGGIALALLAAIAVVPRLVRHWRGGADGLTGPRGRVPGARTLPVDERCGKPVHDGALRSDRSMRSG